MRLVTYLYFDGTCEAAFAFYARVLSGKVEEMIPYAGSPAADQVPTEAGARILHGRMTADGCELLGSDTPPGRYRPLQGFSVSMSVKTSAEAERIFAALAEDGKVTMALQATFFSARFGMLADRYGVPWMIHSEEAP